MLLLLSNSLVQVSTMIFIEPLVTRRKITRRMPLGGPTNDQRNLILLTGICTRCSTRPV